jgi:hypothetical protein
MEAKLNLKVLEAAISELAKFKITAEVPNHTALTGIVAYTKLEEFVKLLKRGKESMKEYYECHITMRGNPKDIKPLVESFNWKFSAIDGDPVLGNGVLCYATRHYNARWQKQSIIDEMRIVAAQLSQKAPVEEVLREKVELVVYDTKQAPKELA